MTLLTGATVLEIGFMVAAPGAARILADLGATVIKVEPPAGDVGRRLFPVGEISVMFEANNRGKQSVVVDLATDDGGAVFRDLVKVADLIVTNLRPLIPRPGRDQVGRGARRQPESRAGVDHELRPRRRRVQRPRR